MSARLIFDPSFDDRSLFEAEERGYLSHVKVDVDGDVYPVTFYDCGRLAQDLEYEVSAGRMCVAEVGMIVLPAVTLVNMQIAVDWLSKVRYFDSLRPVQEGL
jgi:hypothetical protein